MVVGLDLPQIDVITFAQNVAGDVDEPCLFHGTSKSLIIIYELMPPVSESIVDHKQGSTDGNLRQIGINNPLNVPSLQIALFLSIKTDYDFQVRCCKPDLATGRKHAQGLTKHAQTLVMRYVLHLVLAEHIVKDSIFKRERLRCIEKDNIATNRVQVGIEPTFQQVATCSNLQFSHMVRSKVEIYRL